MKQGAVSVVISQEIGFVQPATHRSPVRSLAVINAISAFPMACAVRGAAA
jgi:hypothetical protein